MDLFQVLLNIHHYHDAEIIYVAEPWTLESEARVIKEATEHIAQFNENTLVFRCFLEIFLVKELLENMEDHYLCLREQYQHVIEYALYGT